MCYSAQVTADFRKYERLGGTLSLPDFFDLWVRDEGKEHKRPKAPKALEDAAKGDDGMAAAAVMAQLHQLDQRIQLAAAPRQRAEETAS